MHGHKFAVLKDNMGCQSSHRPRNCLPLAVVGVFELKEGNRGRGQTSENKGESLTLAFFFSRFFFAHFRALNDPRLLVMF